MRLEGLAALHASMRVAEMERARFNIQHNHLTFVCLFLADITPYELVLGCVGHNLLLIYKVSRAYDVSPYLGDQYNALAKALRNGANAGVRLEPSVFLREIDAAIPRNARDVTTPNGADIARAYRHVEEADKVYFCNFRENTTRGHKVTQSNLEKTRLFLGEKAHQFCNDRNLSTCWTDDPTRERPFGCS